MNLERYVLSVCSQYKWKTGLQIQKEIQEKRINNQDWSVLPSIFVFLGLNIQTAKKIQKMWIRVFH